MTKVQKIMLGHGSGGKLSHELISSLFLRHFQHPVLSAMTDSAVFKLSETQLAFTTDSYVVDPLFFPGGNIGRLAVAGTVNDLAVSGAKPTFISAAFIIEEGLPIATLELIVAEMANEARQAGVSIVTGDTKVVGKGKCDKVFINTAGLGFFQEEFPPFSGQELVKPNDCILISGTIGDHGMAVLSARNELPMQTSLESDCACLYELISEARKVSSKIKFMRDATRGGLGTVLAELCENRKFGIDIQYEAIPVRETVRGMCELLGFDPLYVASEGKVVIVAESSEAQKILLALRNNPLGKDAAIIGRVVEKHPGFCWLKTDYGSSRIVDMLAGEQLPRIC